MFYLLFALTLAGPAAPGLAASAVGTPATAAPAVAAPRASAHTGIATVVKFSQQFVDGTSVVLTDDLHYDPGVDDFVDSAGQAYHGPDPFVAKLAEALHRIAAGGPKGRALIDRLENGGRTIEIAYGNHNDADMDDGAYIHWNPDCTDSAPDQAGGCERPAYVGLAHELAHIIDVWNGTVNRRTWRMLNTQQGGFIRVPYAELYATHVENQIRAENGLPLRVSYAGAIAGPEGVETRADGGSLLIRPGTRESLYFTADGSTTYHQLKRSQPAMTY